MGEKSTNGWALWLMPLLVTLLVWWLPQMFRFLDAGDRWLLDWHYAVSASPEPQNDDIVVLSITEDTLEQLAYRSPLDRGFLAQLIDRLNADGARTIVLDLFFDQPTEAHKDAELLRALKASRAPVTVAWVNKTHERQQMTERQRTFFAAFARHTDVRVGIVNLTKGIDGVVRRMTAGEKGGHAALPQAVAMSLGIENPTVGAEIAYRPGPAEGRDPFKTYPAHLPLPGAWLQGKIVLVGAIRPYEDVHPTPRYTGGGRLPGVIIHAHALAQLLDDRNPPVRNQGLALMIILFMAYGGLWLALRDHEHAVKVIFGALLVVALVAVSHLFLIIRDWFVPLLTPVVAFALSLGLAVAAVGRGHRQHSRFLKQAFSRYVSGDVVEALQADPSRLRLGGEKREVTLLFTDIEGFTGLSERLDPEDVSSLLSDYFNGMVQIVFKHKGTLDKFIGDAMVVVFGAPLDNEEHARLAVLCAVEMDAFAQSYADGKQKEGVDFGVTRIGVHTGVAAIGNFGGSEQFNYTAMGDHVNIAARLEGVNKYFGTRVCVSGSTVMKSGLEARFRPVADLVLKGRQDAVPAYQPIETETGCAPSGQYAEAWSQLVAGDNGAALDSFRTLASTCPEDRLVAFHVRRLGAGEGGHRIVMQGK